MTKIKEMYGRVASAENVKPAMEYVLQAIKNYVPVKIHPITKKLIENNFQQDFNLLLNEKPLQWIVLLRDKFKCGENIKSFNTQP